MAFKDELDQHIQRLAKVWDLEDIARKVGLERPGKNKGNWRSPNHNDKSPSLSIYQKNGEWKFKDFSDDAREASGDAIQFLQYVGECSSVVDAVKWLSSHYGMPFEPKRDNAPPRERPQIEWLTDECLKSPDQAIEYLVGRGVPEAAVRVAIHRKSVGYTDWTSSKHEPGQIGHHGPAVAFICRDLQTNLPVAIDKRFIDPALNGDVKTQTSGAKDGFPWVADRAALASAQTVYVVESAINALCVDGCGMPRTVGFAIRGTGNVPHIDWRLLEGKRVVLAFDADMPTDKGIRPGSKAAWAAYEALVGLNISAMMVDAGSWYDDDCNDVADIAKKFGIDELRKRLEQLEPWCIPGLPGKSTPGGKHIGGKARVFLPAHDFAIYWRFRVREDFTSYVSKVETDDDGAETLKIDDVAGFRVAALSRVSIASATSTMSGEVDAMPRTVFAVSVQTARHGHQLLRRVMDDEKLHNVDQWRKLGPIFNPQKFARMLNIMERSADCGAREAVNFVGAAWRDGKPIINEGPDCYFTEPDKQCPYHNLTFPSGRREHAARVIQAYQDTFRQNAAAQTLVWALGGHLKAFLGFWPHLIMQANKGSGKSTLIKRLERTIGFTMLSGQSLQTEFRLLTSICYTSHPIGWEELSARRQDIIEKAVALLQESYQFTVTRRGSDMTEYLICAPVLLAGEDVPVRSLTGKVVRCDLSRRKGLKMPEDLPRFPVREWLQFLVGLKRERVLDMHQRSEEWLRRACRAPADDEGANRMVTNYAAVATAWALLCEFAGIATQTGDFLQDLRTEMNSHIKESGADRSPFVWILESIIGEIESGQYPYPWKVDTVADAQGVETPCLIIRPAHIMDHLSKSVRLRDTWNNLPVKTARVLAKQLAESALIVKDGLDKIINGRRCAHMVALSLDAMAEYGLHLSISVEDEKSMTERLPFRQASND